MERNGASRPTSFYSQGSTDSCCSVDQGKREVRSLMDSFIADLHRTVRDNFTDAQADQFTAPPATRSALFDTGVEVTQPVPGAYAAGSATGATAPPEEFVHKGIWCDSCNKQVTGIRHKCLDCHNFDLCNDCMTAGDVQSTHANMPHTFEAMHPPETKPQYSAAASKSAETLVDNGPQCLCSVLPRPLGCYICKPRDTKDKRTRGLTYRCDSCQTKISGTRHKCMTCPDFDLCDKCYSVGYPISDHSPVHRFMHIEDPIRIITAPAVRQDSMPSLCVGCGHEGSRYKCDSCGAVDACITCLGGNVERATIEHAAFHVEQGWDHPVRFTPYEKTSVPPAASTCPSLAVHPATCDGCDETIVGIRHKCTECHDFDLCNSCFVSRLEPLEHKADHDMLHLDRPMKVVTHVVDSTENDPTPMVPRIYQTIPGGKAREVPVSNWRPTPNVVHRAWCDGCSERIRGTRHKCLDCQDFDFCDKCVGKDQTQHFNGEHQFYAITQPGEVVVRNVDTGNSRVRTRGRPDGNVNHAAPLAPVPAPVRPRPLFSRQAPPAKHSAACDLCSSRIFGVRYKCTVCPDYDVCQTCFNITEEVHPGHSFAKAHKKDDIVARKSPQSTFRHHARCDVCQNQIVGARYKCIHPSCPDFDICERCEALPIPVHPATHAFVKLRSHVGQYDGLKPIFSFAARGQSQLEQAPTPSPFLVRTLPCGITGTDAEPTTATEAFHTASPSPIVPLSTLGCTIVPHTTIVPSLPPSPAPQAPAAKSPTTIPSPPTIPSPLLAQATEKRLVDSWSAASSSTNLDEHVMHHSNMYKPSYQAPSVAPSAEVPQEELHSRKREIEAKRAKLRELKEARVRRQQSHASLDTSPSVHPVTVDEERDPEAPQMTLMANARPVSFPSVPIHEPEIVEHIAVLEPVAVTDIDATMSEPEVVVAASESFSTPERILFPVMPESDLPPLISTFPLAQTDLPPLIPVSVATERLRERSMSGASTPMSSAISVISAPPDTAILSAAFVEDRSIVDGQVVSGGAEFAKCWRMRNDGLVAWPKGTTISFIGGHSMLVEPDMVHWTISGDFTPGKEIDVEVEMKAPEEPGRYVSNWRLKTPEGEPFGAHVWCDIVVAEMERAGSSGSSEVAASSIIVPHAPSMAPSVSPTIHSLPSTVAPSVDTTDVESIGSLDSDDSDVWDEVRRQTNQTRVGRSEGGDGFEIVYDSE